MVDKDKYSTALPEDLTPDSNFRIGLCETTIRTFLRSGMVRTEGGRYFLNHPADYPSRDEAPFNPFSINELRKRGFICMEGTPPRGDQVMLIAGSYFSIEAAVQNGYLTQNTIPFNLQNI